LLYGLIVTVVLLCHPRLGRDLMGNPSALCAVPALWLAWTCLRLPTAIPGRASARWGYGVVRVRIFACLAAGVLPVAVWSYRAPESLYLAVNTLVWIYAAIGFLFLLSKLLGQLSDDYGWRAQGAAAKVSRELFFYVVFVPALAAGLIFIRETIRTSSHTIVLLRLESLLTNISHSNGLVYVLAAFYRYVVPGVTLTMIIFTMYLLLMIKIKIRKRLLEDMEAGVGEAC
jgi:hypothetical protein